MAWYRAEIKAKGYYFDSAFLPEKKVVEYVFQARTVKEAEAKATAFANSREFRKEFWVTEVNLEITITKFIGTKKPEKEGARLIN